MGVHVQGLMPRVILECHNNSTAINTQDQQYKSQVKSSQAKFTA